MSNQQSQQLADRTALLPVPSSNPQLQGAAEQGIAGIYPLYQQLQLDVLAQSYSNAFLICTGITAGAIVLAAMLRKPAAESTPPRSRTGRYVPRFPNPLRSPGRPRPARVAADAPPPPARPCSAPCGAGQRRPPGTGSPGQGADI